MVFHIDQVQKMRDELEQLILDEVAEFERNSGCRVESIELSRMSTCDERLGSISGVSCRVVL